MWFFTVYNLILYFNILPLLLTSDLASSAWSCHRPRAVGLVWQFCWEEQLVIVCAWCCSHHAGWVSCSGWFICCSTLINSSKSADSSNTTHTRMHSRLTTPSTPSHKWDAECNVSVFVSDFKRTANHFRCCSCSVFLSVINCVDLTYVTHKRSLDVFLAMCALYCFLCDQCSL